MLVTHSYHTKLLCYLEGNMLGGRPSAAEGLRPVPRGSAELPPKIISSELRRTSGGLRRTPPESARIRAEFGEVRRTFAGKFFWRKFGRSARNRAESARIRADSHVSARKVFRRAYSHLELRCNMRSSFKS